MGTAPRATTGRARPRGSGPPVRRPPDRRSSAILANAGDCWTACTSAESSSFHSAARGCSRRRLAKGHGHGAALSAPLTLSAIAASDGLKMHRWDFEAAYLQGSLLPGEVVYCSPPRVPEECFVYRVCPPNARAALASASSCAYKHRDGASGRSSLRLADPTQNHFTNCRPGSIVFAGCPIGHRHPPGESTCEPAALPGLSVIADASCACVRCVARSPSFA